MSTVAGAIRKTALTTWEGIWYVLQCIAFGAGYFGKVPVKKALQDFGLVEMTGAEHVWYIIQCVAFGAGYFAKIPSAKALSELPQFRSVRQSNLGTLAVGTESDSGGPPPPPASEPPSTIAPPTTAPPAVDPAEAEADGPEEEPSTS